MFAPIRPTPTKPIFSFMDVNLMIAGAILNHNHDGVASGNTRVGANQRNPHEPSADKSV
jgi:hypothetical protein